MKALARSGVLALSLLVTSSLTAQVGYPPARSPYIDLEKTQELTLLVGHFRASRDPVGVAPQSGTLTGVHYEWRAGGPAHLTAELAHIGSSRNVIDPAKSGAARALGNVNRSLYAADVGLGMALTGARSWHHIVPEIKAGVGFVSDFNSKPDTGGFKFGTRLAITWGGGVRWVPSRSSQFQIRADINNRLYTIKYPDPYYLEPTGGGTAVLSSGQAKSFWTNNPAFTLGISRLF